MSSSPSILRTVVTKIGGLALTAGVAIGAWLYIDHYRQGPQRVIAEQAQRIEYLENVAVRLTGRQRVAKIVVTDQRTAEDGQLVTTLLFMEQWPTLDPVAGEDVDPLAGPPHPETLPAKKFVAIGEYVHIDAKIITFQDHFVAEGDPLRGKSLALFTGLYGSATPPERAAPIDPPASAPKIYASRADLPSLPGQEERAKFEAELWKDFWRLVDEPAFAESRGVDVAYGGAVWGAFKPGFIYELTLSNSGGLELRSTPMPDLMQQVLREVQGVQPSAPELAAELAALGEAPTDTE